MSRAELFKIRTHRTPWVCAGLLLVGVLASPAVLLFYTPSSSSAYADAFTRTYSVLAPLIAIVFGAWLLGTEYRQGTVKRMLATESRRGRALATKAGVGLAWLSAALTSTALIGWSASRAVGSLNDVTIPWNGRELLAAGIFALVSAAVAFGASAITRSDSFAMVGTVGLILVLDPLLSLIPKVGQYSFGSTLSIVTDRVSGSTPSFGEATTMGLGTATLAVGVWLVLVLGAGARLFSTRDV